MVRVRFWIDSSITSERTRIMAMACSSENPSSLRRWTNLRVSKWWSRYSWGVVWKVRRTGTEGNGTRPFWIDSLVHGR